MDQVDPDLRRAVDPCWLRRPARGWISATSFTYLWLNLVGSAILFVLAIVEEQWGFALLEGVWAIVSAWSLIQLARGIPPPVAH